MLHFFQFYSLKVLIYVYIRIMYAQDTTTDSVYTGTTHMFINYNIYILCVYLILKENKKGRCH